MPEPTDEPAIQDVENALIGALHRDLRRQDNLALAYSGGLDSTVLAAMISEYMDGQVYLVCVGVPGSRDTERARRTARLLRMTLIEASVTQRMLLRDLPTIVDLVGPTASTPNDPGTPGARPALDRINPVLVGVQTTLFYAFREAARHSRRVLLGQGADELFGGYARYLELDPPARRQRMSQDLESLQTVARPVESRVAAHHGIDPRYPYLDPGVVAAAATLPEHLLVDQGKRKVALRHIADRLGLPRDVVDVPKTAAQYGSGIAAEIRRLARLDGAGQGAYLATLGSQNDAA